MLDVARHFMPLHVLRQTLHAMAAFKLNVLHLHLSDDQGFRMPSMRYPALNGGEHYSAAEIHELVRLAAEYGIRVVPELDMPGHATSLASGLSAMGHRGGRAEPPVRRAQSLPESRQ